MIERKQVITDEDEYASVRLKNLIRNHPTKKQYDVANDLGVTAGYISHLANGIRVMDCDTLLNLSESLGVSPSKIHPELAASISKRLTGNSSLLTEYVDLILDLDREKRELLLTMMRAL